MHLEEIQILTSLKLSGCIYLAKFLFVALYTVFAFVFYSQQVLLGSVLVSPNYVETLNNAEHFMAIKEYHTAATLFTVALQQLQACPELVATILCKRAECLLYMVSMAFSN